MRRRERAPVLLDGISASIEVEVCVCNRCGTKVLLAQAKELAWVTAASDGRGGSGLDFCGPAHASDYFHELVPPTHVPTEPVSIAAARDPDRSQDLEWTQ